MATARLISALESEAPQRPTPLPCNNVATPGNLLVAFMTNRGRQAIAGLLQYVVTIPVFTGGSFGIRFFATDLH